MSITRRALMGASAVAALAPRPLICAQAGANSPAIRIGVLTDLSGNYRDAVGPTGVACVRQAVQEFTSGKDDMRVEVLAADFQNKPDVGVAIARRWFDQDGVDIGRMTPGCWHSPLQRTR